MTERRWFFLALATAAILGAVGVITFSVRLSDFSASPPGIPPAPPTTASAQEWETFRNEQYGYSIQYPYDWPVDYKTLNVVTFGEMAFEPAPGFFTVEVHEGKRVTDLYQELGNECDPLKKMAVGVNSTFHTQCAHSFGGLIEYRFVEAHPRVYEMRYMPVEYPDANPGGRKFNALMEQMANGFRLEPSVSAQ